MQANPLFCISRGSFWRWELWDRQLFVPTLSYRLLNLCEQMSLVSLLDCPTGPSELATFQSATSGQPDPDYDKPTCSVVPRFVVNQYRYRTVSTNMFINFNFLTFFLQDFLNRVRLVQLTDSVHYGLTGHREVDRKLRRCAKNFVTSSLPPGTPVRLVMKGGTNWYLRY